MLINRVGGGGENVTEEVNVQTPIVESIRNMYQVVGRPAGATATADKILNGYTAYVDQTLVYGAYEPHGDYVWKKLISQTGDFVEYVTSDDSTAYPNGGMKNGYWFELIEDTPDILSPSIYTKVAVDKVKYQSDTELSDITLNHSLGDYPLMAILIGKPQPKSNQTTVITAVALFSKDYKYPNTTYQYYGTAGEISSSCQFSSIAATTRTLRMDGVALQANVEYTLFTFA